MVELITKEEGKFVLVSRLQIDVVFWTTSANLEKHQCCQNPNFTAKAINVQAEIAYSINIWFTS
jgi:hypothetical protein